MTYAELQVTTNYCFLRGASSPDELFAAAVLLGHNVLGITDHNSVAGLVRATVAAKATGLRLVAGCRLDLRDGASLLVWPEDRDAWSRLTRLLTLGKKRAEPKRGEKGGCFLDWEDVAAHADGLVAALVPNEADFTMTRRLSMMVDIFGRDAHLCLTHRFRPGDARRLNALARLGQAYGVRPLATGDILFHSPDRRILQNVITAIRNKCTIDDLGFLRERYADRHLKSVAEMERRFALYAGAVTASRVIAERCTFSLRDLSYQYPDELVMSGRTPQDALERLSRAALCAMFSGAIPSDYENLLHYELSLIRQMGYAPYFLTVNSIVEFARSQKILCQGRGSAANSMVCFVLGITSIDPIKHTLLFERFISSNRDEPPDIDIDFEHERREEVIQWIYDIYGHEHAALTAVVSRFRARGSVREVGKALQLSEDLTGALAGQVWGWSVEGVRDKHVHSLNMASDDPRIALTLDLARQLIGMPRHLSQHPGGFVLTRDRLDHLVPIEPAAMPERRVIEWEKDDIEELRFMKVDVLGLGMLGCMRRAFDLLRKHRGIDMDLAHADLQTDDTATFEMIQKANTLGVFQIESRAQMSMLPRMRPKRFYDMVIQVAIVRPGPIQGNMVHPYLRRREEIDPVVYPSDELREVLEKTLGIPLFQEQAMKVAIVGAGFTPAEADELRRAMATSKMTGGVKSFETKMVEGMVAKGYDRDFATRTFRQIEGFGSYGFPESHAASFAKIAYASSWMKCHHPDIFCCALLNAQPMGFYAPAQIVRDARAHDVDVRPPCVNDSHWDTRPLENGGCRFLPLRLGLRIARGVSEMEGRHIERERRNNGPFASIEDVWRRVRIAIDTLERLADADAFACFGHDRRQAIWHVKGLGVAELPLPAVAALREQEREPGVKLTMMTKGREVVEDYRATQLSLRAHPLAFLRADLRRRGVVTCANLASISDSQSIEVAGIILVRQKPGSAKGVLFVTIEDETGIANGILWPHRFEAQRLTILSAAMIGIRGKVQKQGAVIHVIADHIVDYTDLLRRVGDMDFPHRTGPGDGATHGGAPDRGDPGWKSAARDSFHEPFRGGADPEAVIRQQTRDFR